MLWTLFSGNDEMKTNRLLSIVLLATLFSGCMSGRELALQRNHEIVRLYFERWANHGETAAADELLATNLVRAIRPPWSKAWTRTSRAWLNFTRRCRICILRSTIKLPRATR